MNKFYIKYRVFRIKIIREYFWVNYQIKKCFDIPYLAFNSYDKLILTKLLSIYDIDFISVHIGVTNKLIDDQNKRTLAASEIRADIKDHIGIMINPEKSTIFIAASQSMIEKNQNWIQFEKETESLISNIANTNGIIVGIEEGLIKIKNNAASLNSYQNKHQ